MKKTFSNEVFNVPDHRDIYDSWLLRNPKILVGVEKQDCPWSQAIVFKFLCKPILYFLVYFRLISQKTKTAFNDPFEAIVWIQNSVSMFLSQVKEYKKDFSVLSYTNRAKRRKIVLIPSYLFSYSKRTGRSLIVFWCFFICSSGHWLNWRHFHI